MRNDASLQPFDRASSTAQASGFVLFSCVRKISKERFSKRVRRALPNGLRDARSSGSRPLQTFADTREEESGVARRSSPHMEAEPTARYAPHDRATLPRHPYLNENRAPRFNSTDRARRTEGTCSPLPGHLPIQTVFVLLALVVPIVRGAPQGLARRCRGTFQSKRQPHSSP